MQIDKAEMLRAADAKPCPTRNCGLAAAVRHGLHPHEVLDITIAHRFGVEYQPLLDAHSGNSSASRRWGASTAPTAAPCRRI